MTKELTRTETKKTTLLLDPDRKSPRAKEFEDKFSARIPEKNIPGREAALASEKAATTKLHKEGHSLGIQQRPKP